MMISPSPLSLFCAILLCLPLAVLFTIVVPNSSTTAFTPTTTIIPLSAISPSPLPPPPSPPLPPPPPPPRPPPPPPPTPPPLPTSLLPPLKLPPENESTPTDANNVVNSPPPTPPLRPPPPRPPPEDDPEDVDLLKRASRVDPNVTGPNKKVAFLFMTTTPLPFAPLWELFFNQSGAQGKYNVYIHVDPRFKYDPPFTGVFSGRVIPSSKPTRRNTPTLIAAARRLLANALLDDPSNYMFTLLSGACVPIHSFNFTYHTLAGSTRSFIEILKNESNAWGRWAARGETAMLPEVGLDQFRIGSQFWSLTRRHARVVVEDVKLWRKFRLPCVTLSNCFPEENYFPTLMSMVDPSGVVPATLTNVNWRGQKHGHPHTYNASEVGPDRIRWLRETRPRYGDWGINGSDLSVAERWDPFLFARKFAPNCLQHLISLANDVLFKD